MDPQDFFQSADGWSVVASGQARGSVTPVAGPDGRKALRLDFDFGDGAGFVVLRQETDFRLPASFTLAFSTRGSGPANHFEFKVADAGGANVWRHRVDNFALPDAWEPMRVTERDLPFAWGPAGGGGPGTVGALEFAIVAGPGGKGWIEFAGFELIDESPPPIAGRVRGRIWHADLGAMRRFGGLVLDWPDETTSRAFHLDLSPDGRTWTTVFRATHARGGRTHISIPKGEARFLRLRFARKEDVAVRNVALRADAFSHTPNEFIHAVAADSPRGWFPRYWHREQSYWTPVGSPEGRRRGLLNEEGLLECDEAGFSLEPFLIAGGLLLTWADAVIEPTLPQGGAPMPGVVWKNDKLRLFVEPWVDGTGDTLTLRARYRIECDGPAPDDLRLAVAVRPFQVDPPWQAFRNLGGISPIRHIRCMPTRFAVDKRTVRFNKPPAAAGAARFEEGSIPHYLARGGVPPHSTVTDPRELASAVAVWNLRPDEALVVSIPFHGSPPPKAKGRDAALAQWRATHGRDAALAQWRATLGRVQWQGPGSALPALGCLHTTAGHILINRDGPALQPGPRRYTRSWVRDCVIMGAALVKAGIPHALREFLDWYVPFQRDDGFVPAVVDRDGVDWIVEHDSHGELLWGLRECYRADRDAAAIARHWPAIRRAADYLAHLRQLSLTPDFTSGEHLEYRGLLPESASHEGYLAHPVHSYWDDYWGIAGLRSAATLAKILGHNDDAARWSGQAEDFLASTLASLEHVIARKQLDYLPGSVEWADFDPTATANAIGLLDFADDLPADPMRKMLATYLDGFRRKHSGAMPWLNYTAYEIRIIGAFVRLGMRDEAHELLDRFLIDRRPPAWNQWPEITWHNARTPGHLGDVPHTWIAAEYLLAVASMAVAERQEREELVLASGLAWHWIAAPGGFSVTGLPTRFGPVDLALSVAGETIHCTLGGGFSQPADGIFLTPPLPPGARIAQATGENGNALELRDEGRTAVLPSPALRVTLTLSAGAACDR